MIESFKKAGLICGIKDKYSPSYRLGKIIYPGRAPWEQRQKGKLLILTAGIGVLLGLVVAFVILHVYFQS